MILDQVYGFLSNKILYKSTKHERFYRLLLHYWIRYINPISHKIQFYYPERIMWKMQKFYKWYYRGKNKNKIPHWFRLITHGCVLCWREENYRVYMYGKKPKNGYLWYENHDTACSSHF
jgi:hypothetical protein